MKTEVMAVPLALIAPPRHLCHSDPLPSIIASVTLEELCEASNIELRVTGGERDKIEIIAGTEHYRRPGFFYVGIRGDEWSLTREKALSVLEVLAYGFHDYAARECVCGRGLYTPKKKRGRPALFGQAMTSRERVRRMRARKTGVAL